MTQSEIKHQQQYYIHPDHLGSYNVVTTSNKAVAERYHFAPWGNRKNPASWSSADTRTLFLFDRGFTGHEHLDFFKIINMNARLYDPVIGRFFSPDPYVQMPEFTQNFNRYSYCLNNPLKYVDPSGKTIVPLGESADKHFQLYLYGFNGVTSENVKTAFSLIEGFYDNVYSTSAVSYRDFKRNFKEITGQKLDKVRGAILYKALASSKYYEIATPSVVEATNPSAPPVDSPEIKTL